MQYRQCVRCVMDTTDPYITFDKNGYCNHCTDFLNKKAYLQDYSNTDSQILERIVQKIKKVGKGKKYDCVLGISGGADSCYAAYICKELGLRTLLVHFDNGWNTHVSTENIEVVVRHLGFDYVSYVIDWEEFKDLQLSFLKASVPEIETPTDIAILGTLNLFALKYDVKHIIMGCNNATESILPRSWHYNPRDMKYLLSIQKKFGTKKLKSFPFYGYTQEIYAKLIKRIKNIYILNYVPYNRQMAIKTLEKLGWKNYGQKHYESFYTRFVQSYILPEKFNIDYRKVFLSIKILNGEISREDVLHILSQKPYDESSLKDDIEFLCKKLEITPETFYQIMALPPKSYKDYPNDEYKLKFLYKTYHILKNILF